MKVRYSLFLAAGSLLLLCGIAAAHPPASLEAALQPDGKLRVMISHTVNDPVKHFISRIVVTSDGKVIAEEKFTQQSDKTGVVAEIPAAGLSKGQTVQIEADCNIFGSLKKTFTL
jgi:desulfoferrodoxin (superoxide reductase-like protein)